MTPPLLQVENLSIAFDTPDGVVQAVDGLSYTIAEGGTLAIVGESGSGKSQAALAVLGLCGGNARVGGSIRFEGQELIGCDAKRWRGIRGERIGMVFQDPMSCLNPHLRVGLQMAEVLVTHRGASFDAALNECARMLDAVGVSDTRRRLLQYPHELSGGLRQRVMIAMTLLCQPRLLIADEPTTALDVTVQAQLLELLAALRQEFGLAILLITHDLGLVGELCEDLLVMYAGQMMEHGASPHLLTQPSHPYTAALLRSRPQLHAPAGMPLHAIPGNPPDLRRLPAGCPFQPRCGFALPDCATRRPLTSASLGQGLRACHREPAAVAGEH